MKLSAWLRETRVRRQVEERAVDLAGATTDASMLERLNVAWTRVIGTVPYYRELVQAGKVPREFSSLRDYLEAVPITTRADVQRETVRRSSAERPPDWHRTTGGSTSEPIRMPAWKQEFSATNPDLWLARSWYGIRASDRQFTIWGHSHLLGTGLTGWINGRTRVAKDWLLGYRRFSAYDLNPGRLREAARQMLEYSPAYLVGYSTALALFGAANRDLRQGLRALKLKAVIGAAEAFPSIDAVHNLEDLFGAPVAMEYGSVETGLIAHTHPEGGYTAFSSTYLIEADQPAAPGGSRKVRVTSLYDRCFPLVRYEMGDELELEAGAPVAPVCRFISVRGRCNQFIELPDGARIHSEAVTHAVRALATVTAYQLVHQEAGAPELRLALQGKLSPTDLAELRHRLVAIDPRLACLKIATDRPLIRSVAGKTPMIVHPSARSMSQ